MVAILTTEEEPEVHDPHVRLLVPWHLVLRHQAGEDRIRSSIFGLEDSNHLVGDSRSSLECGSNKKNEERHNEHDLELIHVLINSRHMATIKPISPDSTPDLPNSGQAKTAIWAACTVPAAYISLAELCREDNRSE